MSNPPDLQDLMHRAVRDTAVPDAGRLAYDARRRGLAIRRRRQAMGLVGVAAASALVLGGVQVARGPAPQELGGAASGQTSSTEPVEATGEMAAAALVEALAQVQDGAVVRVAGSSHPSGGQVVARVWWRPADGSGDSIIGVTVRPVRTWDQRPDPCEDGSECETSWPMSRATVETLREQTRPDQVQILGVATSERGDGVRVTVTSTNGRLLDGSTWEQTRPLPALDRAQLRTIVMSSVFGLRMDPALADPDRLPTGYVDLERADVGWARLNPAG